MKMVMDRFEGNLQKLAPSLHSSEETHDYA